MDAIQAKLTNRQKDLENKKVELSKIIEKTEKEETKLAKESDKAKKDIDDRILKSYEKIRKTSVSYTHLPGCEKASQKMKSFHWQK